MIPDSDLLRRYAFDRSEAAFTELVRRRIDLVYAVARRQVGGDAQLAEDVVQRVFADLARKAPALCDRPVLSGWLCRSAQFAASDIVRAERRRRIREQEVITMQENAAVPDWDKLRPVLDQALNELEDEDRDAVALRFFEARSFAEIGAALRLSEEAARKRVDRALGKLETGLRRRGVTSTLSALTVALAEQMAMAAPPGLAATVASGAIAGAAGLGAAGSAATLLNLFTMSKLKIGIVTAIVAAVVAFPWLKYRRASADLETAAASMRELTQRSRTLAAENTRLARGNAPVVAAAPAVPAATEPAGGSPGPAASLVPALKADPEMWAMLRSTQKTAMVSIYTNFAQKKGLPPEQTDRFTDMLADDVMENVDHVISALRDGKTPAEMDQVFSEQEASLLRKVETVLGPEALAGYQEYTHNLAADTMSAMLAPGLDGQPGPERQARRSQLREMIQGEIQRGIAAAGLPPDYQAHPVLNFRNFAFESETEKSLGLLDEALNRARNGAGGTLTPEEIGRMGALQKAGLSNLRAALAMNRMMMSPPKKE